MAALRSHQALEEARHQSLARLDALWLLGHVLKRPSSWLLAHDHHALADQQQQQWGRLLARRLAGEPLAYVIGEQQFCGLTLRLTPAVLIPRPETELLVEWAVERLRLSRAKNPAVLDLGTGSGAVALALQQRWPAARITGVDNSEPALEVARANGEQLGMTLQWLRSDWWSGLSAGAQFDLVVSNPPYIHSADPHLSDLTHEPLASLTPGGDGLSALQHIVAGAARHLVPGAWLLLEHGHDQAQATQAMLQRAGFDTAQTRHDLAGLARCTGAGWPT